MSGWWFQPLWKILVNWDDYSQKMEKKHVQNHRPDLVFMSSLSSWSNTPSPLGRSCFSMAPGLQASRSCDRLAGHEYVLVGALSGPWAHGMSQGQRRSQISSLPQVNVPQILIGSILNFGTGGVSIGGKGSKAKTLESEYINSFVPTPQDYVFSAT